MKCYYIPDLYLEFVKHVQEHLINDLSSFNVSPSWSTNAGISELTSFQRANNSAWLQELENFTEISFTASCQWHDQNGQSCGYEFLDFDDYLCHNYYHAHLQRQKLVSEEFNNPYFCQAEPLTLVEKYTDYKKEVLCQWKHQDYKCEYVCMVPEFMQKHVVYNIECEPSESIYHHACKWDDCQFAANSQKQLKSHVKQHFYTNKLICHTCNREYPNVPRLQEHFDRSINVLGHQCDICKKWYQTERLLNTHKTNHKSIYKCDVPGCHELHVNFSALTTHKR